ncbi:MAG TPA: PASTA domain-containing protein [Gaiellaceae bacterium]
MPKTRVRGRRVALVAAVLAIAFAAAALLGSVRSGSTATSETAVTAAATSGTATAAPVVNFWRLARKHFRARVLTGQEFEALPPHWQQRQEGLERVRAAGRVAAPRARTFRAEPSAAPSPSLANNFSAVDDNSLFIPPDTEGAPGLDKLVVTVNGTVRIQRKSDGTVLSSVLLNTFFNAIPSVGTVFDPHVLYDPYAGRWIVAAVSNAESPTADLLLAVSQSSDPGGNWNEYSVDVDASNVAWADYPTVGFNKNWIVLSVNLYAGNSFAGVKTYAFDKAAAYAGGGGPAYQVFSLPYPANNDFSLAPAATYDPNADDLYLTEDYDGTGIDSALPLRLFKLSGPVGSATLARVSDPSGSALTTLGRWSDVTAGNVGFAPQLGSNKPIDNGDARLTQCVYRNGAVWCTNTVFLPLSSPNRSAVQWYEIDPATSRVLQAGRIQDATGVQFFAYSSIAVNKYNDALLGFSRFAANQYASADYAYRGCGDPANAFRDEAPYKAGAGSYFKTYSGIRNRWGDYSGTWVDPSDDASMWTIQEYAKSPPNSNSGTWGTWWGALAPQLHDGPVAPSPASSDHTPGVSSANQVVHVSWAPPDDCAVRYVYKWSTNSGDVPDPASDPSAPATTTALASPALTPGSSWWLHVETLDGGGTASSVAHLGPFPIVSAPPPPPPSTTTTTTSPPPPPPVCVVPAVKGKTLAAASASLQAAHCKTGVVTRRYSSKVLRGRVISQGVAAGTNRADGAAVSLVVSKGIAPFRPPVRVTVCYRHRTLHVTRAVWRRLHRHGATLGRCRPRR